MAKKRNSIFDVATSQTEISDAAKKVQKAAIDEIPVKEEVPTKTEKDEKPRILYVNGIHHRQAKIGSSLRGMKLGEYIEWLIDQDKGKL
ncbi:MAG: hypothetical protein GC192_21260 [Bacteroidetes bacterium]|nr:hypothetical protein [Bacteroidota bacterium]